MALSSTSSDDAGVQLDARPGEIRIGIDRLMREYGPSVLDSLLERVVTTDIVEAVEADRQRGTVTIEYDGRRHALADALAAISRVVDGHPDTRRPDQEVSDELRTLPGVVLRVERSSQVTGRNAQALVACGWRRIANLAGAGGCFVLAVVGFITPGIPTVPFVLGTSYFLVRSTPALNDRLRQSWLFGALVRDWEDRGGMRVGTKIKTIALMLGLLGTTVLLSGASVPVLAMSSAVGGLDLLVVLWLPTVSDDSPALLSEHRPPLLLT